MKVRLIVPNCDYKDASIVVRIYGKAIANIAGGFTAMQGTGGWIDGKGVLIVEPVTVFDCHYGTIGDSDDKKWAIGEFRKLAKRIAKELNQDCVYLEIDGNVEFVKP